MSFKKGLATLLLGTASLFPSACSYSPLECLAKDTIVHKKSVKEIRSKADKLWVKGNKDEAIKLYMSLLRVEDILGDSVKYVKYNANTGKTNFDGLVYQAHEKVKKPVLVLFYSPPEREPKNFDSNRRQAIVFRHLAQQYVSRIKFIAYNGGNEYVKPWSKELIARLTDYKNNKITNPPSIGMYGLFDFEKGETLIKHTGKIKQIDLWKGGPNHEKYIVPAIKEACMYWIDFNVFGKYLKTAEYTYKHANKWKIKRVNF